MTNHNQLTETMKFDTHIQSEANGLSGGIVIMWKEDIVKIESLNIPHQDLNMKMNVYDELCQIVVTHKTDWQIGGDVNEVLHAKENLGGASINNSLIDHLRNCLNKCGIVDLGYKGCKYT
ncbi:hypothetical protein KY289_008405 [Solanum tuberosum]|nr:hypothetical protein KY289_008405 [Solanum tuberosum]